MHAIELRVQIADHEVDQVLRLRPSLLGDRTLAREVDRVAPRSEDDDEDRGGDRNAARDPPRLVDDDVEAGHGFDGGRTIRGSELFEPRDERRDVARDTLQRQGLGACCTKDDFTRRELRRMRIESRKQKLQEQTERVHVARRRERFAARLFGAHVQRRAHGDSGGGPKVVRRRHRPRLGERHAAVIHREPRAARVEGNRDRQPFRRTDDVQSRAGRRRLQPARKTEVEDLHLAGAGDHDILGFEIAMDDPDAVRGDEHARDRQCDAQALRARNIRVDEVE
ncbi:MAG TPA: hypothetical protein VJZ00_11850 [Thermoanaerobaculia bacterium]|nr:hypothetical protein [Thermoanaerobaculia bacterium]